MVNSVFWTQIDVLLLSCKGSSSGITNDGLTTVKELDNEKLVKVWLGLRISGETNSGLVLVLVPVDVNVKV